MKVRIVKPHHKYPLGEVEVQPAQGIYLLRVGVAERVVDDPNWVGYDDIKEKQETKELKEKKELKAKKEKAEIKTKIPIQTK